MTDNELARRYQELSYRMLECAMTPDHPTTQMNHARWEREWRQTERELDRRELLEPRT